MSDRAAVPENFSAFQNAAKDAVVSVDVTPVSSAGFGNFSVKQYSLEPFKMSNVVCDPVCINRTTSHIAKDGIDDVLLMFQLAGDVVIGQNEHEFLVRKGDLAVLRADRPYRVTHLMPCHRLFLRVPKSDYLDRVEAGRQFPAFIQLHREPLGRILSNLMMSVASEAQNFDDSDGELVTDSVIDIVARLMRYGQQHSMVLPGANADGVADRAFEFMERHYRDSNLCPKTIADGIGISVRHLHAIVSGTGATVGKWIWERRLSDCYEALQNPRYDKQTITEIAFKTGFSDSAHFSRAFRARFGLTPSEVRKRR